MIHTVSGKVKLIDPRNKDKNRKYRPQWDSLVSFENAVVKGDTEEELLACFLEKIPIKSPDPIFPEWIIGDVLKAKQESRFEVVEFYSVNTHGRAIQ